MSRAGPGVEQSVNAAGGEGSDPVTPDKPAGPADHEPADVAAVCRDCHVLLAATLWPRLCELDPELPAELLRANFTVHLVAESRVSTPYARSAMPHVSTFSGK